MSRYKKLSARPMHRRAAPPTRNIQEERTSAAIDKLALFEAFERDIMPILKQALEDRADSKEILKIGKTAAAIQLVLKAQSGEMPAIKELLDRTDGKPVEKKAIVHAMAEVKDEQLDALLLSALGAGDDEHEEDES